MTYIIEFRSQKNVGSLIQFNFPDNLSDISLDKLSLNITTEVTSPHQSPNNKQQSAKKSANSLHSVVTKLGGKTSTKTKKQDGNTISVSNSSLEGADATLFYIRELFETYREHLSPEQFNYLTVARNAITAKMKNEQLPQQVKFRDKYSLLEQSVKNPGKTRTQVVAKNKSPEKAHAIMKRHSGNVNDEHACAYAQEFRLYAGAKHTEKVSPLYNNDKKERIGIVAKIIQGFVSAYDYVKNLATSKDNKFDKDGYNAGKYKINSEQFSQAGGGNIVAGTWVVNDADAYTKNWGFNQDGLAVRIDWDFAGIKEGTARYKGLKEGETFKGYHILPEQLFTRTAYNIHHFPNIEPKPFNWFVDHRELHLLDIRDAGKNKDFVHQKYVTFLSFILADLKDNLVIAKMNIGTDQARIDYMDKREHDRQQTETAMLQMEEVRRYLKNHPDIIDDVLARYDEYNQVVIKKRGKHEKIDLRQKRNDFAKLMQNIEQRSMAYQEIMISISTKQFQKEILEKVRLCGVDACDADNGNTLLMQAINFGNIKAAQALVALGADPTQVNYQGQTAYQLMLKNKEFSQLVRDCVDVDDRKQLKSNIYDLIINDNLKMLKLIYTQSPETALYQWQHQGDAFSIAASKGMVKIVDYLLESPLTDQQLFTALKSALNTKHYETAAMILVRLLDVQSADSDDIIEVLTGCNTSNRSYLMGIKEYCQKRVVHEYYASRSLMDGEQFGPLKLMLTEWKNGDYSADMAFFHLGNLVSEQKIPRNNLNEYQTELLNQFVMRDKDINDFIDKAEQFEIDQVLVDVKQDVIQAVVNY